MYDPKGSAGIEVSTCIIHHRDGIGVEPSANTKIGMTYQLLHYYGGYTLRSLSSIMILRDA
jgi:hypothetical protein